MGNRTKLSLMRVRFPNSRKRYVNSKRNLPMNQRAEKCTKVSRTRNAKAKKAETNRNQAQIQSKKYKEQSEKYKNKNRIPLYRHTKDRGRTREMRRERNWDRRKRILIAHRRNQRMYKYKPKQISRRHGRQ